MGIMGYAGAATLDNYSDALIVNESALLRIDNPKSIFTNPVPYGKGVDGLVNYAFEGGEASDATYPRYWMGFRATIRLLLCFLDYYQIKRYVAALFFALFSGVMCSIAKNADTKAAFLFALSIISVRPQIIALSLQFSCCFLLAFMAMLMMPWLSRHPEYEGIFFLETGIITMYFDFYTTPIITFGLPLVYLYLLRNRAGKRLSWKKILTNGASWLAGYGGMWIVKLVLVTVFTDVNGLQNGIDAFFKCIGVTKIPRYETYNFGQALEEIKKVLYSDDAGRKIVLAVLAVLAFALLIISVRKRVRFAELRSHAVLLAVAAVPVLWFAVGGRPIVNHAYFQYRSVVVIFWAVSVFFMLVFADADAAKNPLQQCKNKADDMTAVKQNQSGS